MRRNLAALLATAVVVFGACGGGDEANEEAAGEETVFANGVATAEDVVAAFEQEAGGHDFEEATTLVDGAVAYSPASGPVVAGLEEQLGESSVLWQVLVFTGSDPPLDGEAAGAAAFSSNELNEVGEGVYIGDQGIAYAARGNVVVTGPAGGSPQDATLTAWRGVLDGLAGDAPTTAVADVLETEEPESEKPETTPPSGGNGSGNGDRDPGGDGGGGGGGGGGLSSPSIPFPQPLNAVRAGDCIADLDPIDLHLGTVDVVACSSPHRGQAIEVLKMGEARWPGSAAIRAFAEEPCTNALGALGSGIAAVKLSIVNPDKGAWTKSAPILCIAVTKKPVRGELQAQAGS